MIIGILFSALIQTANAGKWADFCERHLVAEDPYQYEEASSEWIERELAKYWYREVCDNLTNQEKTHLRILRRELARRQK